VLAVIDRRVPSFAFAVVVYAIYLGAVGAWLLPRAVPASREEVLRAAATGAPQAARCGIVFIAMAFVFTNDLVAASRASSRSPC
jgi:hypothetical protein